MVCFLEGDVEEHRLADGGRFSLATASHSGPASGRVYPKAVAPCASPTASVRLPVATGFLPVVIVASVRGLVATGFLPVMIDASVHGRPMGVARSPP